MLDTINNMLATHSKIQQNENKSLDLDRNRSDKFSDHVSAVDDQPHKERRKPEEVSPKDDQEPVSQKQGSERPERKNETAEVSDAEKSNTSNTEGQEEEVSFEAALLLLNEVQEGVEEGVEFIQATPEEGTGIIEQNSQAAEAGLGRLGETLGDESAAIQASSLAGEVKNVLKDGEGEALNNEGELLSEEQQTIVPKDFQQKSGQDTGKGKEEARVIEPLQRTLENAGARKVDTGQNTDADNPIEGINDDLLAKDPQAANSAENTEGLKEKKSPARVFNVQSNAAQNTASNINIAANQTDLGVGLAQNIQNLNTTAGLNISQGITGTQQTQQVPLNNIALHIAGQAQNGAKRFDIQLDPPELGRIDVRLDVTRDGSVNTHIVVERSETLDLMQRDSKALEKALIEAGLDMQEGDLQFSLKEEGFQGEEFEFEEEAGKQSDNETEVEELNVNIDHIMDLYRQSGGATGLDIRV